LRVGGEFGSTPFIPWLASPDGDAGFMAYVVKWIPKDQDVTIDHGTKYEHPDQALEFACNALTLTPKRI
jgi:hypothetical protein